MMVKFQGHICFWCRPSWRHGVTGLSLWCVVFNQAAGGSEQCIGGLEWGQGLSQGGDQVQRVELRPDLARRRVIMMAIWPGTPRSILNVIHSWLIYHVFSPYIDNLIYWCVNLTLRVICGLWLQLLSSAARLIQSQWKFSGLSIYLQQSTGRGNSRP